MEALPAVFQLTNFVTFKSLKTGVWLLVVFCMQMIQRDNIQNITSNLKKEEGRRLKARLHNAVKIF